MHVPHANAYPIAGRVKDFRPDGYPGGEPMVPHGMSVALTAPEAFRFTFEARPERHVRAAELLDPGMERPDDVAEHLPLAVLRLMRDIGMPDGIGGVGYDERDIPGLVEGAMKQQRLLAIAPRPVDEDAVAGSSAGRCGCGDAPRNPRLSTIPYAAAHIRYVARRHEWRIRRQ